MIDIYDLDVALEIVGRMMANIINEFQEEKDKLKKILLKQEIDILKAEENTLYTNTLMQKSVIDKAFRLYAPILKAN